MQLHMCRSLWGAPASIEQTVRQTVAAGFAGIEGPVPIDPAAAKELRQLLDRHCLAFIAEATTGQTGNTPTYDWWIPEARFAVEDHLQHLTVAAHRAVDFGASFLTTMCGYDAWSWSQNLDFFGRALELERSVGLTISFETHRSRSLFNPWTTRDLIRHLPAMKLTCDFSHWCVVAERLIDTEIEIIRECAERAQHVHCRVGYAQHAQVSDPAAPEFALAVAAHERWWQLIWEAQRRRGMSVVTMTSEFGPDGYLPLLPHTQTPVADLWSMTCWMAEREKSRFAQWGTGTLGAV